MTHSVSETLKRITARGRTSSRTAEHTIRWVLAHDPPVVFEDASREFAETVREKTDGSIDIELFNTQEFIAGRGGETVTRTELNQCLANGEIEMAHTYVSALGAMHNKLWAIELPFLFRDYDHADRVFEGPIADQYMKDLIPSGVRGLCFAYSGGYRIIPSKGRAIRNAGDFDGLRIRTSGNPVPGALFERLGATAVPGPLENIGPWTEQGKIDAAELTYVRFLSTGLEKYCDTVNETSHSMFTTMMVINERFFRSLTDKQQAAIADAGRAAGRIERQKALDEEKKIKALCPYKGVEIVEMSDEAKDEIREVALEVYEQFTPQFGGELIEALRA
jgi:TRAP-type C4-dicarboxylate transport system substrate-binding protein